MIQGVATGRQGAWCTESRGLVWMLRGVWWGGGGGGLGDTRQCLGDGRGACMRMG